MGGKLTKFPPGNGTRERGSLSPLLLNIVLKGSAKAVRIEKDTRGIKDGKEEGKVSMFADFMTLYQENPNTPPN